jgi:H+/Cl- antiporter ClcA
MQQEIERILDIAKILILSVIVGIVVGALASGYGQFLLAITDFRYAHEIYLLPFLGFAGVFICSIYQKWGGETIRGMTLIFEAEFGERKDIPIRMIPIVLLSTWLTHLFGGSAGREGVAVQIGGTIGFRTGKLVRDLHAARILLIAGMAAGFAGLFRTPLAAVFFALEVLVAGQLSYEALVPTIVASLAASITSGMCGLGKEYIPLTCNMPITAVLGIKLLILALAFGFAGQLFSGLINKLRAWLPKVIPNPRRRIFICGIVLSALLMSLWHGRYTGLGLNLSGMVFNGTGHIFWFDWLLKLLFTVVTLSSGFQGGELTPLFCIGSTLGAVLAVPLGLPVTFCAALGYAAVFGSATNTLLAPVIIACEIFGFQYMPFFFFVCALAYAFNGNHTIYPRQKILHPHLSTYSYNKEHQLIKTSDKSIRP